MSTHVSTATSVTTGPIEGSTKHYLLSGDGLRVPVRRVHLTNGEHLDVYDTSGPYTDADATIDLEAGLPQLRDTVDRRPARAPNSTPRAPASITAEMRFIAAREGVSPETGARRGRARARGDPGQPPPPRARADDHRQEVRGEDQRQHRQLGGHVVDRRRGREDGVGDPLGRRHHHGPVHRQEHPRDPRVDPAQLARPGRHGADLPGAGEGRTAIRPR